MAVLDVKGACQVIWQKDVIIQETIKRTQHKSWDNLRQYK